MRTIDKIFDVEFKFGDVKIKCFDILVAIVLTTLGVMFRFSLYDIESGDYVKAFADWMKECHAAGGLVLPLTFADEDDAGGQEQTEEEGTEENVLLHRGALLLHA